MGNTSRQTGGEILVMLEHCMFGCKPCNCVDIGTHWDLHCKGNPESRIDEK